MKESTQILLFEARVERLEWVLQRYEKYLKEHELEDDYDAWFWNDPESG